MINLKNEEKALKYIEIASSLLEPNLSIRMENFQKYHEYVYAISYFVTGIDDLKYAPNVIEDALRTYKTSSDKTIDSFKASLNAAISTTAAKKYYLLYPTNINYNLLGKRHFNILGTKIYVYSYNQVKMKFKLDKLEKAPLYKEFSKESLNPDIIYFMAEQYEVSSTKAIDEAFGKIDLLRGIINFCYGIYTIHLSAGRSEPLSYIQPKIYLFEFNSDLEYSNYWFMEINFGNKKAKTLSEDEYKRIIKFSSKVIKTLDSIENIGLKHLIIDAFKLYNTALDYYEFKWITFLSFWQMLELISLYNSGDNIKFEDICPRILSLIGQKEPYRETLEMNKRKRNLIVHHSKTGLINDTDINMIKPIAEAALLSVISNAKYVRNKSGLNIFYDNINDLPKNLKLKTDILNQINRMKSKKAT
jgi:hypothetical protein